MHRPTSRAIDYHGLACLCPCLVVQVRCLDHVEIFVRMVVSVDKSAGIALALTNLTSVTMATFVQD